MHCVVDVLFFFGSGADEFSACEQEYDHLGFVHAVDEAWELFGFVHGFSKRIYRFFQVNHAAEACRGYDVLDFQLWFADDYDAALLEFFDYFHDRAACFFF